jgi:protein SCO1/2
MPNLTLYDTSGRRFQLREMKSKSKRITFSYVRCLLQSYCPAQSQKLAALQHRLDKTGSDVHLVSLTLYAEHDDAKVLANYANRFNADPARWTLAGGNNPEALRRFAHRAGARVREYEDNFQIDHALVGLRVEGDRIVDRVYGLHSIAEIATVM